METREADANAMGSAPNARPEHASDADLQAARITAEAAAAASRYQGTVKRGDGATFLRAIELGPSSGMSQTIRIFEQLGGSLPSNPQYAGTGIILGPYVIFTTSDNIAERTYVSIVLGTVMISISHNKFFDNRPVDPNLAGLLTLR